MNKESLKWRGKTQIAERNYNSVFNNPLKVSLTVIVLEKLTPSWN